jgi:predicted ferric reductase
MDRTIAGVFWFAAYLAIIAVPILLMLVDPVPSGRGFMVELANALGFVGLTQIGLQFLLIARFRRLTAPYGINVILRYHRQIAVVAVLAILLHPILLMIDEPSRLKLLRPPGGNWATRFGVMGLAALLVTVPVSIMRERLRLNYEHWRFLHVTLGVLAIAFAQLHVSLAGLYTNTAWKHAVWIAMAGAMVGLVVYLRVIKPAWQRGYRWRVAEVRPERGDTHTLVLEPVRHGGFRFAPGQFAWVKLARSPFTLEEHPLSFTSSAERPGRLEFGIKALGDFSAHVGDIPRGTRAYLDGPHGAFSHERYSAAGYVFVAGGIGITPFLSILRTMADRGDPRPATLIYADKKWDDVAYREELDELAKGRELDLVYVLENPPEHWRGERGLVTPELLERRLPRDKFRRMYMICGPPVMMEKVRDALIDRGVSRADIQFEHFTLA